MSQHNPKCFANHLGLWAIEPHYLSQAVAAIVAGVWKTVEPNLDEDAQLALQMGPATTQAAVPSPSITVSVNGEVIEASHRSRSSDTRIFPMTPNGIAVLQIVGPMMKAQSKFGGTSTVAVRQQLRAAVRDSEVRTIVMLADSPGGHVAGTHELAEDIREANARKGVIVQIEDFGASALMWAASQAGTISANITAQVGSIGAIAVVEDTSKANEMAGIKTHVVSTGAFKGSFAQGAPITKADLGELQQRVDDLNSHFLRAIETGRGLTGDRLEAVSDGRIFSAEKALELGLIDHIRSTDETFSQITSDLNEQDSSARLTREAAEARLRLEKARG